MEAKKYPKARWIYSRWHFWLIVALLVIRSTYIDANLIYDLDLGFSYVIGLFIGHFLIMSLVYWIISLFVVKKLDNKIKG